jgi:hypothetical protein
MVCNFYYLYVHIFHGPEVNYISALTDRFLNRQQGFSKGSTSGPTHAGVGGTSNRARIHFAKIYSSPYFGLLGRADYIFMESTKQSDGRFKFDMKVWKNLGSGGAKMKSLTLTYVQSQTLANMVFSSRRKQILQYACPCRWTYGLRLDS